MGWFNKKESKRGSWPLPAVEFNRKWRTKIAFCSFCEEWRCFFADEATPWTCLTCSTPQPKHDHHRLGCISMTNPTRCDCGHGLFAWKLRLPLRVRLKAIWFYRIGPVMPVPLLAGMLLGRLLFLLTFR